MSNEYPQELPEQPETGHRLGTVARRALTALLRELVQTVLPAVIIVLAVNVFVARACYVENVSMEPTLHEAQRLILEKVSYYLHPPERGDIIVFYMPEVDQEPLIKRVIAVPGETIEIRDGHVLINGQVLEEPYLRQGTYPNRQPTRVPDQMVFVLGDNRGESYDSRYFGFVPFAAIRGRACFRYWPLMDVGVVQ
jgi:signal peptidase I